MKRLFATLIGMAVILMTFDSYAQKEIVFDPADEPAFSSSASCGKCHQDIYRYWKDSMHANALQDYIFQAAYMQAVTEQGDSARGECLSCHAPTTAVNGDIMMELPITNEAVTCDYCHRISDVQVKGDKMQVNLSSGDEKYGPLKSKQPVDMHASVQSDLFTDSLICATCHQWSNSNGLAIFDTYKEWQEGPYSKNEVHCQNCHMPLVEGAVAAGEKSQLGGKINSHNLSGGHSIIQVASAAQVRVASVSRVAGGLQAVVEVSNVGSGHMIPTGTPSRKLILDVQLLDSKGSVVESDKHIFQKIVLDKDHNQLFSDADMILKGASISKDNRIGPGETVKVPFNFAASPNKEYLIRATLSYSYRPMVLKEEDISIEMGSDFRRP